MPAKLTAEKFITRAKLIHNNKYNYNKINYIRLSEKIIIICQDHGEFEQVGGSHLAGQGCSKCIAKLPNNVRKNKINRETNFKKFVEDANKIHNKKYDYSKVNYINNCTKIEIICQEHGEFLQAPKPHLMGHGCSECSLLQRSTIAKNNKKLHTGPKLPKGTNEIAIKRFIVTHGDKYNYDKINYINQYVNVTITCKIHGDFEQCPRHHWNGAGCNSCALETRRTHFARGIDKFIEKSKLKFGSKFSYNNSKYINQYISIKIFCDLHGEFEMLPKVHLKSKYGCSKCANIAGAKNIANGIEYFTSVGNQIHNNKYDYSLSIYTNNKKDIKIICKLHGEFEQNIAAHLNGCGCPKCLHFISKPETEWLNLLNISDTNKTRNTRVPGLDKRFRVDGFLPEKKICLEFHGDFFHGCPIRYNPNDTNVINKKTFGELYRRTKEKEKYLLDNGYNLIVIWESKFNQYKKDISSGLCKPEDILNYCEIYLANSK